MIDFAIQAERNENNSPEESIYQACLLRFRPIMMTTMPLCLAACPLPFPTETAPSCGGPWASPSSAA